MLGCWLKEAYLLTIWRVTPHYQHAAIMNETQGGEGCPFTIREPTHGSREVQNTILIFCDQNMDGSIHFLLISYG